MREADRNAWEASRKLVAPQQLTETLAQLVQAIHESSLSSSLQALLMKGLGEGRSQRTQDLDSCILKELTGLPTTKALRALCVVFSIGPLRSHLESPSALTPSQVEEYLKASSNPYDLLLQSTMPSLLDLGAGDLSFQQELVEQFLPILESQQKLLTLHALDRLQPGSQFGGVYHASSERVKQLKAYPSTNLRFQFWGGIDMMNLSPIKGLLPTYTIVSCHAPATPTFAFEPSRTSRTTITETLKRTKGEFRLTKIQGEQALEVQHRGKVLTFPDWKFEIHGPLALFDLMASRGQLCVLSAIDGEVFWEMLAQLLEDDRFRPQDLEFNQETLPLIFGSLFHTLEKLPIGQRMPLADFGQLRKYMPAVLHPTTRRFRFRYVEIRRGGLLEGIPSSFTARQFAEMNEESTPWWLILIPESIPFPKQIHEEEG